MTDEEGADDEHFHLFYTSTGPGVGIWRLPQRQHVAPSYRASYFLAYHGLSIYGTNGDVQYIHGLTTQ